MNIFLSDSKKCTGFTLIELMVAIAISVILLNGVIQMFVSSKQAYRTADGLGRMQENARYAMETLAFDLRQAGFSPCRKTNYNFNLLNDKTEGFDTNAPLFGFEAGGTFDTSFPPVGTATGTRIAGADGIRIIRGGDDLVSVAKVPASQGGASPAATLFLSDLSNLVPGEIIIVCDDVKSATVQVTNTNSANVTVVHNTGGSVSPGNCSNTLTDACGGDPTGLKSDDLNFGEGAQVVNFKSLIYYIGPSLSNDTPGRNIPNTNSLYRREQGVDPFTGNYTFGAAQELVEGIETMQLVYGEANSPTGEAVKYVPASDVTNFANVVSIRVGLLLHTPEEISPTVDDKTYNVVGTIMNSPADFPADRRQRYLFTETIHVRNRGISVKAPG